MLFSLENEKNDHSDSDDNSSSSQDEETDVENNVDEEFRRRIKEALGNAGPDEEDDVDESVDEVGFLFLKILLFRLYYLFYFCILG